MHSGFFVAHEQRGLAEGLAVLVDGERGFAAVLLHADGANLALEDHAEAGNAGALFDEHGSSGRLEHLHFAEAALIFFLEPAEDRNAADELRQLLLGNGPCSELRFHRRAFHLLLFL